MLCCWIVSVISTSWFINGWWNFGELGEFAWRWWQDVAQMFGESL